MLLTGDIADVITYDPLYQEQIVAFPGEDPYTAVDVFIQMLMKLL